MAIVSKGGGGGGGAGGEAAMDSGGGGEVMTNLPPRTGPICGRRDEMQTIVELFNKAQKEERAGVVEVTGKPGTGATSVAVELARRAGGRFPGGAWVVRADLGPDLAWADLAACRGETATTNLAESAQRERDRAVAEPRSLIVLDGVSADTDLDAVLPDLEGALVDFFLVSTEATGRFDDVVEVSAVPEQAPRRIAHAVLRVKDQQEEIEPPIVRVKDGLAITASLAARVCVAHHPNGPPRSIDNIKAALMQIVPLVAQHATALELLLVCGVAHPTLITADALYGAIANLRARRGMELEGNDVGTGVLHLVRLGLLTLDEESRVSMHPLLQEAVRGMARAEEDLAVAREGLAEGLIVEATEAMSDDGVDVRRVGLHQLRHLRDSATGELQARLAATVEQVEGRLGIDA
jgi:hypothetical protein